MVNYLGHHLTRAPKKTVQLETPFISEELSSQHFTVAVDMRYSLARRLFYLRQYEPATSRVFALAVAGANSVIDVGANIGYYTLMAARLLERTGGHVFAFEPVATLAREIEASVQLNNFQNVRIFNKAAGVNGSVQLFLPQDDWTSAATSFAPQAAYAGHTRKVTVESLALDDLIEAGTIRFPDVIKIDAEGAEPQVLKGLHKTLSRDDAPDVICEVLPELPEINDIFQSHGYAPYRITQGGALLKVTKIEYAGGTDEEDYLLDYLMVKRPERRRYWETSLM